MRFTARVKSKATGGIRFTQIKNKKTKKNIWWNFPNSMLKIFFETFILSVRYKKRIEEESA